MHFMKRTSPFVLLLTLVLAPMAIAQQAKPKPAARKATPTSTSKQIVPSKPNDATAAAAATPTPTSSTTPDSPAVAIVNETTFTAADIEPTVTQLISTDP